MDCSRVVDLLSEYIDGMLDDEDKNFIEIHLKECKCCRQEYEILRNIVLNCRMQEEIDLPEDFENDLHKRLEAEKKKRSFISSSFIYRHRGVAAVFLVLTVSAAMLGYAGIFGRGLSKKTESATQNTVVKNSAVKNSTAVLDKDARIPEANSEAPCLSSKALDDKEVAAAPLIELSKDSTDKSKADDKSSKQDDKVVRSRGIEAQAAKPQDVQDNTSSGNPGANIASENGNGEVPDNVSKVMSEPSYDMININLSENEYKNCVKSIENDIKSMQGSIICEEPIQYSILDKYRDQFMNKLKDEYKLLNIDIKNISLIDNYNSLKDQESNMESKLKSSTDIESAKSMRSELDKNETEIKKIEEQSQKVLIQLNIIK